MKTKTATLAGLLLAAGVVGAADPTAVVDPAAALKDAAKEAAIENTQERLGVPEGALDQAQDAKDTVEDAGDIAADPEGAVDQLKDEATGAAVEKATEALTTPKPPKLP
jgi:hypothetical protein